MNIHPLPCTENQANIRTGLSQSWTDVSMPTLKSAQKSNPIFAHCLPKVNYIIEAPTSWFPRATTSLFLTCSRFQCNSRLCYALSVMQQISAFLLAAYCACINQNDMLSHWFSQGWPLAYPPDMTELGHGLDQQSIRAGLLLGVVWTSGVDSVWYSVHGCSAVNVNCYKQLSCELKLWCCKSMIAVALV